MALVLHRDFLEMKIMKVFASGTEEISSKDFMSLRQPVLKYTSPSPCAQACSFYCDFRCPLTPQRVRWLQSWVPLSPAGTRALCSFSRRAGGPVSSSVLRAVTLSLITPASLAPGPVTLQKIHFWAVSLSSARTCPGWWALLQVNNIQVQTAWFQSLPGAPVNFAPSLCSTMTSCCSEEVVYWFIPACCTEIKKPFTFFFFFFFNSALQFYAQQLLLITQYSLYWR